MKITNFILTLAVFAILILTSSVFAQQFEPTIKTGSDLAQGNQGNGIEYIFVDKSRIVSEVVPAQAVAKNQVNTSSNLPSGADINNWTEPKRRAYRSADDIEYGKGFGVDMDVFKDSEAFGSGAVDARQACYIREDSSAY